MVLALAVVAALQACGGGGGDAVDAVAATPDVQPAAPNTAAPPSTPVATPAPPAAPEPPLVRGRGELKGSSFINTIEAYEVAAALAGAGADAPPAVPLYAVRSYRLTYVTLDGQGREVMASGLVAVPQKVEALAAARLRC
jgi:hypothetical protein